MFGGSYVHENYTSVGPIATTELGTTAVRRYPGDVATNTYNSADPARRGDGDEQAERTTRFGRPLVRRQLEVNTNGGRADRDDSYEDDQLQERFMVRRRLLRADRQRQSRDVGNQY